MTDQEINLTGETVTPQETPDEQDGDLGAVIASAEKQKTDVKPPEGGTDDDNKTPEKTGEKGGTQQLSTATPSKDLAKPSKSDKMYSEPRETLFNSKGEKKLYPDEVLSILSAYNDFSIVRNYGKTRFQMKLEELANRHLLVDPVETVKYLKAMGHEVSV